MAKRRRRSLASSESNQATIRKDPASNDNYNTRDASCVIKRQDVKGSVSIAFAIGVCVIAVLIGLVANSARVIDLVERLILGTNTLTETGAVHKHAGSKRDRLHHEATVLQFDVQRRVRIEVDASTGERGLFLNSSVSAGDVILEIPPTHFISVQRLAKEYPTLRGIVEDILLRAAGSAERPAPSSTEFLLTLAAILEWSKGDKSRFFSYFQSLPTTSPDLSLHWTDDERSCVFGDRSSPSTLPVFHDALRLLREERPNLPLGASLQPSFAEYMYTMVLTRGFGGCLVPVLDLANHDPLSAVPPFQSQQQTHLLVATHDAEAGAQVYNSYGNGLAVDDLFASYGYVPESAVLVTAPSLAKVMEQHALSHNSSDVLFQRLCLGANLQFFGPAVPERRVSADWSGLHQTTTFAPGRPTQLTYQCLRVVLNAPESNADMARWIVPFLQTDIQTYDDVAASSVCNLQSPHYRVNRMARDALQFALEVAEAAALGHVAYPGLEYP